MIDFKKTHFLTSVVEETDRSFVHLPELLMVGRSNVGKSSLINALTSQKSLAKVSSTPGKTRLLNYFEVDKTFYLVDAPGYGYAKQSKKEIQFFGSLMKKYFANNTFLKGVVFLLDARRTLSKDDLEMLDYLHHYEIKYLLVFTKVDKLNQSMKHQLLKQIENTSWSKEDFVFSSILKPRQIEDVRQAILGLL